jgi:hypothetical protein
MAYIGRQLARGENKLFDDISSSFNGSTTVFNLTVSSVATSTATPYQLFVSLGGVMQKPNTDFTTAGNQITFTTAPAAGLSCWIMIQGDTIDQAAIPDASVTPSKIAGSGDFAFPADVRLNDGDGSHYVGFQAPTTVSTNKIWTLPAADGSANQYLKTDGSGTLSWGSDSTSDPSKMPLAGGTFTGDVTFTGDASNGLWDKSASAFVANLTGTASIATSITVADESSDTTCNVLFATAATGNLAPKSGTNLTFNSSSGALTATSFVGALTGNASGSAATVTGAAQSAITSLGTLTGLTVAGDTTLNAQGDLRFADSDSSNWVAFQAPATITSNVTWTLPAADGSANQLLTTNGSGTLSWSTVAGGVSSDAQNNTVGGTNAGDSFTGTDAVSNSLFGKDAGTAITSGDYNTGMGHKALLALTTGEANTAYGQAALEVCQTGTNNTAIGYRALNVTTSVSNTACGHEAGRHATTGGNNAFFGKGAGFGNSSGTSGGSNTAVGALALHLLTSGDDNVAVGQQAATNITAGASNVAVGYYAMKAATTCSYNIVVGEKAAIELGTGGASATGNVVIGRRAAYGFQTGSSNVFVGYQAGPYTTTTSTLTQNTCVGNYVGFSLTSGDHNIGVGHEALQHDSPSGVVTTQSGILCLGSDQITDFYCEDTSISSSDKRDKTDITDFTHGLKWVNQLKPVTYRWDKRTWYKEYNEDGTIKTQETPDGSKKKPRQHIGFLAQDVLAIEQADGFASKKNDMLVVNINEDETRYGLKYERLVPVLVNAIKELSTEVNTLKTKVAALEAA